MSKDFTFVSRQFGLRETLPLCEIQDATFDDVADRLYKLLLSPEEIYKSVIEIRDNILPLPQREGVFKFFYVSENNHIPIPRAERVMDFYERTGRSEVYFFVDVIGGGVQYPALTIGVLSQYAFLAHALDLMQNFRVHGVFSLAEYNVNRFRLSKVVRDRYRRTLHVFIEPTPQYPRTPPLVVTSPAAADPCFSHGGRLDWAYARGTLQPVWNLTWMDRNPLVYLLDELFVKYRLAL